MELTLKEKMANTIADNQELFNDVQCYDETDLLKMICMVGNGEDLEKVASNYEDVELYFCDTYEDLAEQFIDEGLFRNIPDNLINYIDYEKIGRDLSYDGYDLIDIDGDSIIYRYF